jgi:PAS domain S-box-containing protein
MKSRSPHRDPDSNSLAARLRLQEAFFQRTIQSQQLLQPLDRIPGVIYFVKDAESRMMAISSQAIEAFGFSSGEQIIGLKPHEFMAKEIADQYLAGDRQVLRGGKPVLNIIEMGVTPQGGWDWIFTDKYPLRDINGEIVGLVGITQSLQARRRLLAHLGPVGNAADFIREHLGESLPLSQIAKHVGLSERQLQRIFRRVFRMTIHQFIIRSRIHAAIQTLTHTDHSIAEAAAMYGFSDQSAFTNRFRQVTGMSPRMYRNRYVERMTP